jgi:hypothetical protein
MQQIHMIRREYCAPKRCASLVEGDVILYLPVFICFFVASLLPPEVLAKSKEKKPGLSGPACPTVGREV